MLESCLTQDDREDPSKCGTYQYNPKSKVAVASRDQSQQAIDKDYQNTAAAIRVAGAVRSREWRGVAPPEGEDTFYISQARM